jgi:anti-sigma B factor antagonist
MTAARLVIPGPRTGEPDDPPLLAVAARTVGPGVAVVVVRGDLDATTAPRFDAWAQEQLDGRTDLVLDLDAVGFLASAGIGALMDLRREAGRRGVALHLTGRGNHAVVRPLTVLKLERVLDLQPDADTVLAALLPSA